MQAVLPNPLMSFVFTELHWGHSITRSDDSSDSVIECGVQYHTFLIFFSHLHSSSLLAFQIFYIPCFLLSLFFSILLKLANNPTIVSIFATIMKKTFYYLEQETHLIQACIDGDRQSQNRLYAAFAPKMFAICLRYCKNREEAEEILQEGFVQVFRSLKNFKYQGSFEGWVRKIMVYSAIQYYRSKTKLHPVIYMRNTREELTATEDILSQLGKKELLQMVQALPPAYRMVFNLYVFEGMKHREIAAHLGISEGTSKSNFFDAKIILQKAVAGSLKIAKINYQHG